MLEVLKDGLENVRTLFVSPRIHAERLAKEQADRERERGLKFASTFGRIALSDYRRGCPDFELILGEFRHEMRDFGFTLDELGLTEADRTLVQELTDLE